MAGFSKVFRVVGGHGTAGQLAGRGNASLLGLAVIVAVLAGSVVLSVLRPAPSGRADDPATKNPGGA